MQDILAILIAVAAAGFLVRRAWLRFARRQGGACGGCGTCGSDDTIKTRPLVTISTDLSHAKAPRRKD